MASTRSPIPQINRTRRFFSSNIALANTFCDGDSSAVRPSVFGEPLLSRSSQHCCSEAWGSLPSKSSSKSQQYFAASSRIQVSQRSTHTLKMNDPQHYSAKLRPHTSIFDSGKGQIDTTFLPLRRWISSRKPLHKPGADRISSFFIRAATASASQLLEPSCSCRVRFGSWSIGQRTHRT